MAERVAGEDLVAQDDEVADDTRGQRGEGAGQHRVLHEVVAQRIHATALTNRMPR